MRAKKHSDYFKKLRAWSSLNMKCLTADFITNWQRGVTTLKAMALSIRFTNVEQTHINYWFCGLGVSWISKNCMTLQFLHFETSIVTLLFSLSEVEKRFSLYQGIYHEMTFKIILLLHWSFYWLATKQ